MLCNNVLQHLVMEPNVLYMLWVQAHGIMARAEGLKADKHTCGGESLMEHKDQEDESRMFSSVQFSCSVVSDSFRPHESQHARPPCPGRQVLYRPHHLGSPNEEVLWAKSKLGTARDTRTRPKRHGLAHQG